MIKNLLDSDEEPEPNLTLSGSGSILSAVPPPGTTDDNTVTDPTTGTDEPYIIGAAPPHESIAETARKSGLAYSAAIALFASVAFMLIIGWGADLLFGTWPWGTVAGIVFGSIIGFVQFFRITSRIYSPDRKMENGRMLMTNDDDSKLP
jgi:F0F1-type ATP synthase assembly protein I